MLGNAGGTIARQYGHFWPRTRVDGVEIDSELTDVGYRYFDMGSNPNLTVDDEDARPWLRASDDRYDMIVIDAYRQPYIPFYMATKEFFELARDHLAPEGVVVVNVGHPEGNDEFEHPRADDGRGLPDRAPRPRRADEQPADRRRGQDLRRTAGARRARSAARQPAQAREHRRRPDQPRIPGGTVYTDDRAPVEWLVDRSILGYAEDH